MEKHEEKPYDNHKDHHHKDERPAHLDQNLPNGAVLAAEDDGTGTGGSDPSGPPSTGHPGKPPGVGTADGE